MRHAAVIECLSRLNLIICYHSWWCHKSKKLEGTSRGVTDRVDIRTDLAECAIPTQPQAGRAHPQ